MDSTSSTITLTFGDQAENHSGMQQIGEMVDEGFGFNLDDLQAIKSRFEACGITCVLYDLGSDAHVLVLEQAVDMLLQDLGKTKEDLFEEQASLKLDKHALMYGKVVQKHARWNLCFSEEAQEADYAQGKGTVVAYNSVPLTLHVMSKFETMFGEKAKDLKGEGNYYYDVKKCGVGYHGDAERRKVVAVRLGAANPIHYQWYFQSKPVREHYVIPLDGGDMYVMSEKAVGTDWKKRKLYTLRHAVGPDQFTKVTEERKSRK